MFSPPPVVMFTTASVALLDHRQEAHEHGGVRRRLAGLGIARVQMDDRRARLGRLDRRLGRSPPA